MSCCFLEGDEMGARYLLCCVFILFFVDYSSCLRASRSFGPLMSLFSFYFGADLELWRRDTYLLGFFLPLCMDALDSGFVEYFGMVNASLLDTSRFGEYDVL